MNAPKLVAPVAVGAGLGLAAIYRATGLRAGRAADFLAGWADYQFGRPPEVGNESPLAYSIALGVIGGGSFGAFYGVTRSMLRLPGLLTGTLCGVGLWGIGEAVYRSQPDRRQDWSGPPGQRLPTLAAFGAAVAFATDAVEGLIA